MLKVAAEAADRFPLACAWFLILGPGLLSHAWFLSSRFLASAIADGQPKIRPLVAH